MIYSSVITKLLITVYISYGSKRSNRSSSRASLETHMVMMALRSSTLSISEVLAQY